MPSIRSESARRTVAEPTLTFGIADHYVPTRGRDRAIADPTIADMVAKLETNTSGNGIRLFGLGDPRQGIVHVVGPEQGLTLPGLLIVCGDSHTSTHGAFGAYAFGIGASEVAHVLMTQTLWQKKPKRMRVTVSGKAAPGIAAKDIALSVIARIGADGAQRPCGGIRRQRDRGAVDGRPHDPVQHVDRGRRALRHGGAGRDHFRLSERAAVCAEGRGVRPRGGSLVRARVRSRRDVRSRSGARCRRDRADRHLGHDAGRRAADRRERARSGARSRSGASEISARCARLYGDRARQEADRTSRSIASSSARAPTPASKICARRPPCSPAARAKCRDWSRPALRPSSGRPRRKVSTASSAMPASNGRTPDARCASASTATWCRPANAAPRPPTAISAAGRGRGARTHLMSPAMVAAAAVTGHLTDVRQLLADRKAES